MEVEEGMNKKQIIDRLKFLGEELVVCTTIKVEENDKVFAIQDIKDTIHDLGILIDEIRRL